MNERIEGLVAQATERQTPLASDMADWQVIEKFAELIIRECMDVVDTGENQLIARFQARQSLSNHFGMNESEQRDENIRNRSTYFGNE